MAIDEFAKAYLHDNLRWARSDLLGMLDGLSEYDVRRPMTRTGTNLLGLVKHLTISEAHYLGSILGETNRHLGHADQLREEIDGVIGYDPTPATAEDDREWAGHWDRVEQVARAHL